MLLNCGVGEGCWRVPWTTRRFNQSILKKVNPDYSAGLMLKLQYFGHPMQRADSLEKIGKDCKQEEKWTREDVMVGGHHRLNGLEFEQAPGGGEGQGSLGCCSPWGCKELDTSEWLNNNNKLCVQFLGTLDTAQEYSVLKPCRYIRCFCCLCFSC